MISVCQAGLNPKPRRGPRPGPRVAAELNELQQPPDWESLRQHAPAVGALYGAPDDIWAPPQHAAALRAEAPAVAVAQARRFVPPARARARFRPSWAEPAVVGIVLCLDCLLPLGLCFGLSVSQCCG